MRILVVEDDARVARGLVRALRHAGHEVATARTGAEALAAGAADVVLLDLGLPDVDGVEVLRRLRRERPATAVIAVTARAEEADRVLGLRAGADDYVVKPFGTAELLARVDAVLRRTREVRSEPGPALLHVGGLALDPAAREVRVGGGDVLDLTRKEADLLCLLAARAGTTVRRDLIVDQVWHASAVGQSRTVDTHVASVRAKLAAAGAAVVITTVRGTGYRLEPADGTG